MAADRNVDITEVDTCRICSAPAEEDQPLFYPCKCSGTIRYIHQDCLTTWLAHSKKRSCDVCKYEYGFTKVYKNDMPNRLPAELFLRKLSFQMAKVVVTSLRLVMISVIWLAILPYLTLWVWRFYFWTGEALAYWVVGRELPDKTPPPPPPPSTEENTQAPSPSRPSWTSILPQDLGADIFKGQIITIAVVIVFLTIFLLREWIIQNARPGVFGDDEVPEAVAAVPDPAPAQEPVAEAIVPVQEQQMALQEALEAAEMLVQRELGLGLDGGRDTEVVIHEMLPGEASSEEDMGEEDDAENDSISIVSQHDVVSMSSGPETGDDQFEQTDVPSAVLEVDGTQTENLAATQRAEQDKLAEDQVPVPSSSKTNESSGTVFGASTRLGGDLSLPSSFAFSSPATASESFTHSAESSLDGSLPPDSQMYESLSSSATQSQIQASVGEFHFSFPMPHSASLQNVPHNVPLPDSPLETRPDPFRAISTDSTSTASTSATRGAPRVIKPMPAGPSKRMSSSTPAFKGTREFDDFRFSFSSTPTILSRSSSRPSSRPPLPPSTPGVDEPVPVTDSPHVALYRPPEDMKADTGYFDDRLPLGLSSSLDTTESSHTEQPASSDDEDEEMPYRVITPLEPDEPMPPLEAYDNAPERLIEAPPAQPVIELIEDRAARQRVFADLEQRVAQLPRVPVEDEDDGEEDAQDAEPMGDDDMDGALEAIGMRGPITSVFQNVFLMIFIIDLAIAVGIWMPFTMGKTTALLFLQPADVLALVRFPIIAVRIMTDPIVDGLLLLFNLLLRPLKWGIARVLPFALPVTKPPTAVPAVPKTGLNFTVLQNTVYHHWDRLVAHSRAAVDPSVPKPSPTSAAERIIFHLPAPSTRSLEQIESQFAVFGRTLRLFSHAFARRWQQLTIADGTSERAFAIFLGYIVLCMVMGIYLGILNTGAVRGAARALRNAVKQQLIVVKVALFIGLELLVFPTGCGVVLDIATLPLFESATLAGRIAFYDFAPLTAFFCHWLVGTIFMYQFALTLGACRAVMRPGAMWFIKDPQDASFSPIRDILDKRVLTQLRKLTVSAVMYTVVIVVAVGSVVYTIRYAPIFSGILPLRGNMRVPLSEIPVDLLFLHLVMPPTVKRLTIGSWMKTRLEVWWKYTARQLRLSSFMFNQLHADELQRESKALRPMHGPAETWTIPSDEHLYGRWLRVPKSDNIAFLRDQPVLIQVDRAGRAVRQRGEEVMAEQDEETRRAGRTPEQDYIIVHVPPYFGGRCLLLVMLLWITAASITVTGTVVPILLGRLLLSTLAHKSHVHDGYSLVIGWYVLWGLWRVHRSQVRSWTSALAWVANTVCIGIGMGVIMPILVAVTLQMYVVLPLRLWWNPETVPVLRIAEDWALGLVLMKIGWQTWRLRARAPAQAPVVEAARAEEGRDEPDEADRRMEDLGRAMEQIIRAGLTNPDAITAIRTFIAPVCGGLVLVIGAPGAIVWALGKMYGAPMGGDDVLLSLVYPGMFCGTAAVGVWRAGSQAVKKWLQGIRDEEFLVEMRLKNLEPTSAKQ